MTFGASCVRLDFGRLRRGRGPRGGLFKPGDKQLVEQQLAGCAANRPGIVFRGTSGYIQESAGR